jgi:hypothetical protein
MKTGDRIILERVNLFGIFIMKGECTQAVIGLSTGKGRGN